MRLPDSTDAEHRAHEGQEEREEARHGIGRGHVVARVQHDEHAHERDQHGKQPCIAVQPKIEFEPKVGHPRHDQPHDLATGDLCVQTRQKQHAAKRREARKPACRIAGVRWEERRTETAEKRQQDDQPEHRSH